MSTQTRTMMTATSSNTAYTATLRSAQISAKPNFIYAENVRRHFAWWWGKMNGKTINKYKKYLLILPCSKRKKRVSKAHAIELYDGPFYRVVRKSGLTNLDILILSAKYGLIGANDTVSYYDQVMSHQRAMELANDVRSKLEELLESNRYDEIFINLGKTYIMALENSKEILASHNIYYGTGQIGKRLNQLKKWLGAIKLERGAIYD